MEFKHVSVLLNECLEGLNIKPDGKYVDCTLGYAGHSSAILKRLKKGKLLQKKPQIICVIVCLRRWNVNTKMRADFGGGKIFRMHPSISRQLTSVHRKKVGLWFWRNMQRGKKSWCVPYRMSFCKRKIIACTTGW